MDRIISYDQLLTNLRNDLQNNNLDLPDIEFVDLGRSMRVWNQRIMINYYDVAIGYGTRNLVWSLLPKQRQPNSDSNTSAPDLPPDMTVVQISSCPVSSSAQALPLSVIIAQQIPIEWMCPQRAGALSESYAFKSEASV